MNFTACIVVRVGIISQQVTTSIPKNKLTKMICFHFGLRRLLLPSNKAKKCSEKKDVKIDKIRMTIFTKQRDPNHIHLKIGRKVVNRRAFQSIKKANKC